MRIGMQHLHFYAEMDDTVIEVRQDYTEVAIECDEIFTEGLGPCIGVAFSWLDRGYMFHGSGMQHNNDFEAFLEQTCESLTAIQRGAIRPVVAGGDVTGGVGNDVLHSREFCLVKLSERGFGIPHECWCPDDSAQAMYLDVHRNTVRVHTESIDITSDSQETMVDIYNY